MIRGTRIKSSNAWRRGFSIIELLIVITGIAIMLGVCAITLQLLMRLNVDVQARLSGARALERLSGQLRDDVHSCEAALLTADSTDSTRPAGLRLTMEPDHSVTYGVRDGSVVRDESRAGKPIRHEAYLLPRGRVARFEQRSEAAHRLVALVMTQVAGKSRTDPPLPLEVVALPGKDRLVKRGAGS